MKNSLQLLLAAPLVLPVVLAGQTPASTSPAAQATPNAVYVVGPDVSAPKLVSVDAKLAPAESCKDRFQGHVALQFVLDKAGIPRDIGFVRSDEFKLNSLAEKILRSERFHPALRNGQPVPVSFVAVLTLSGCQVQSPDDKGNPVSIAQLVEKPGQKLAPLPLDPEDARWALTYTDPKDPVDGGQLLGKIGKESGIAAPVALNQVMAEYSQEAKNRGVSGTVLVTAVVDPTGQPRDVRVLRGLGYGLDEEAIKAVDKYSFKPAMKDGQPVPVSITVEITFHL